MTATVDPLTLLVGDAAEMLRTLPEASVQCCVTSPPYWGLRDYGTARWEGGDDPACRHVVGEIRTGLGMEKLSERYRGGGKKAGETKEITATGQCPQCGAVRIDHQIGLEPTPEAFVERLVGVFREVWRVLKDDGTLWMNLGDSYASNAGGYDASGSRGVTSSKRLSAATMAAVMKHQGRKPIDGLKPKDLVGIPWMVAFALRADGWYLRQDIIWHKPNPMPESVTDRCTKAHEYLFLLTKSQRYYYDAEAIKEPVNGTANPRGNGVNPKARYKTPDGWDTSKGEGGHGSFHKNGREKGMVKAPRSKQNESFSAAVSGLLDTRNKRSVWTVGTEGFAAAHFATYPPNLIRPCIRAGSRPGDVVLDPFGGSGTTGQVALEEGRRAVLIELNPEYAALCRKRCSITMGLGL